ncbi:MAG: sigma-70 family RNA polymerase sigma factor [Candidatus Yonathbacteria bacterium]|nr:sigma-70 family RNA polymerase sigma factor [Candidatus Yonathbacteria bacterium]
MKNQGVEDQFLGWHNQFADAVFRHCFFRLSDREKAKDVTQETFVRLWEYISSGKEIENARALIYRIVNNLIIDEYRKKDTVSLDQMQEETDFDRGYSTKEDIENKDDYARALEMVETLPAPYREVLVWRHIDGLSVKEIADIVGESENLVSVRIHRAIEKLKTLTRAPYEHNT